MKDSFSRLHSKARKVLKAMDPDQWPRWRWGYPTPQGWHDCGGRPSKREATTLALKTKQSLGEAVYLCKLGDRFPVKEQL